MKKIWELLKIPLILISGYSLMTIMILPVAVLIIGGVLWLITESIFNPSWYVFIIDALVVILARVLYLNPNVKKALKEFSQQFFSNM